MERYDSAVIQETTTGLVALYFDCGKKHKIKPIEFSEESTLNTHYFPIGVRNVAVCELRLKNKDGSVLEMNRIKKQTREWIKELVKTCNERGVICTDAKIPEVLSGLHYMTTGKLMPDGIVSLMVYEKATVTKNEVGIDLTDPIHLALAYAVNIQNDLDSLSRKQIKYTQLGEKVTLRKSKEEENCYIGVIEREDGTICRAKFNNYGIRLHKKDELRSVGDDLVMIDEETIEPVIAEPTGKKEETKYVILYINKYGETVTSRVFDTEEQANKHSKRHDRVLSICGFTYENPYA